jgi:hypothetical protein
MSDGSVFEPPNYEHRQLLQQRAELMSKRTELAERRGELLSRRAMLQSELSKVHVNDADGLLEQARAATRASHAATSEEQESVDVDIAVVDAALADLDQQIVEAQAAVQAAQVRELQAEVARLAPLVDAQRQAVGESGAADLGKDYLTQATGHAEAWKRWGIALVLAIAAAIAFSLLLFQSEDRTDDKLTNGAVIEIARDLLIVGLLIYLVRLASLQFRVHRHLEAVARNKAAALSTFTRMVAVGSEPEIRDSLSVVLAQAVFTSDETGFVDATGDHVTLIERAAGALPKPR